jgi:hypothetical protein
MDPVSRSVEGDIEQQAILVGCFARNDFEANADFGFALVGAISLISCGRKRKNHATIDSYHVKFSD